MICKGFSLIELLVYSALSIFLVVLVFQFLALFERLVIGRSGEALYQTSLYVCIDSIVRDCAAAPADPRLWSSEQPHKIMWQNEQGLQGFECTHGTLVRVSRSRDSSGILRAPVYSTLLHNVEGSFTVYKTNNLVSMVGIALTARYRTTVLTMNKAVYLHAGVVS